MILIEARAVSVLLAQKIKILARKIDFEPFFCYNINVKDVEISSMAEQWFVAPYM